MTPSTRQKNQKRLENIEHYQQKWKQKRITKNNLINQMLLTCKIEC